MRGEETLNGSWSCAMRPFMRPQSEPQYGTATAKSNRDIASPSPAHLQRYPGQSPRSPSSRPPSSASPVQDRMQMVRRYHDGIDLEGTFIPGGAERGAQGPSVVHRSRRAPVRQRHRKKIGSGKDEVA